jgi:multisubunit Na+/H+ antiporter MnhB subunit
MREFAIFALGFILYLLAIIWTINLEKQKENILLIILYSILVLTPLLIGYNYVLNLIFNK